MKTKEISTTMPESVLETFYFARYFLHEVMKLPHDVQKEKYESMIRDFMDKGYIKKGKLYKFLGFWKTS